MIADSILRLLPGVLGKQESFEEESFSDGLLEYYHYTRPAVFRDKEVPPVLLSGNHQKIAEHRRQESLINTYKKRPELLETAKLTAKERRFIETYAKNVCPSLCLHLLLLLAYLPVDYLFNSNILFDRE